MRCRIKTSSTFLIVIYGFFFAFSSYAEEAYQLLRADPTGYGQVLPGKKFEFPQDHLPHKPFRIEWWYLTANLKDSKGEEYGIHWTLFRQSMSPNEDPGGWQSNQVWMAHTAVSTPQGFEYEQRFARGGIGQAGVHLSDEGHFVAWLDDWQWRGKGDEPLPGSLKFSTADLNLDLNLEANRPWVFQGDAGYSQKSEMGQASYYYSQPHIQIEGSLTQGDERIALSGQGWLDREWSSQPLAPNQPGWDWLSLHLDDGFKLMVYRLRQTGQEDWLSGSWISPDGEAMTLKASEIVFEPVQLSQVETPRGQKEMPLHWHVALPSLGRTFNIAPMATDHWLDTAFPYWEGPVKVSGEVSGRGYLELTGY